jgi:hypothetical protein
MGVEGAGLFCVRSIPGVAVSVGLRRAPLSLSAILSCWGVGLSRVEVRDLGLVLEGALV